MRRRRLTVLIFAAGLAASLACLYHWRFGPRCEDYGLYTACLSNQHGWLRAEFRNTSTRSLRLADNPWHYEVRLTDLGGFVLTDYSAYLYTSQLDLQRTTADDFVLLNPHETRVLILNAYDGRGRLAISPLTHFDLRLHHPLHSHVVDKRELRRLPLIDLERR